MKKIDIKSVMIGFLIGCVSFTTVSAVQIKIKSAEFNTTKVMFNGQELNISQPMITVVNEGSQNGSNYMPVRAVLEAMDYKVGWDGKNNAVLINDKKEEDGSLVQTDETKSYTQEEYDNLKSLFEFGEWELNDYGGKKTSLLKVYYTKQDMGYYEFLDFFRSIPNKNQIITDILLSSEVDKQYDYCIEFIFVTDYGLHRYAGYVKMYNGSVYIGEK